MSGGLDDYQMKHLTILHDGVLTANEEHEPMERRCFLMKKYVLVIGAAPEVSRKIQNRLEDSKTEVLYSTTPNDAQYQLRFHKFVIVMVELGYVCQGSQALFQSLHEQSPVPILVLYANACAIESCGYSGLESGDTLNTPFDMDSCITRAKSHMEHYSGLTENDERSYVITCGHDLVINPATRTVSLHGEKLELSKKQFDTLYFMATHPGQVLSKDQIFDYLWGEPNVEVDNSIALYISKLRKKLGDNPDDPSFIQTVRGIGYKFTST